MGGRRIHWGLLLLALVIAGPASAPAQEAPANGAFPPAVFALAKAELAKVRADLRKIEGDLRGHDQTIAKGEALVAKARERGNAEVEAAAREYLQKARDAKARDEATRSRLLETLGVAEAALAKARTAMGEWVKPTRDLIAERLADAGTVYRAVSESLQARKDPPVPPRKAWADLRPGDVLLVAPDGVLSGGLRFVDKLTSWEWGEGSSRASHSFIYLKTVNGQKIFLDDQLGEGPRLKTEEMILNEYKGRDMDVAHPVAKIDADKLWRAARELEIKNLDHIEQNAAGLSTYSLYGDDHMVCSEAGRWALIQAWPEVEVKDYRDEISDTGSPFKKMLGVYFGPANFYADRQHFVVSGLDVPPPRPRPPACAEPPGSSSNRSSGDPGCPSP